MRVFVTGATGFIGSAIVPDLLKAGHEVVGLTRSESGVRSLAEAGTHAHRGDLDDLESLRRGAAESDGVIHTAFGHDFSRFAESSEADRQAIETLGEVLHGSERPLVVTAGVPSHPGRLTTEDDAPPPASPAYPRVSEQTATALAARGVNALVVRLPQVHDRDRQGLASYLVDVAREKGVSAYVGEGRNRWSAVHRLDAAPVYRLALERGSAGARYHAVGEEGVTLREVAEAIGRAVKLPVRSLSPEEAARHFGGLAFAAGMDNPASSTITQEQLGWRPTAQPDFVADLESSTASVAA